MKTSVSTIPEDIVKQAGVPYRSIDSFYHPITGWRIATDTAIISCNEEKQEVIVQSSIKK